MYRKTILANGITVVTESLPYFSSFSVGIWWKTGGRNEHAGNNGIAHFIEHMLFKGTERRSARDIAREFDAVGGSINAFTGKEYTCLYARVLKKDADLALDILADMYRNSRFDADDINRERYVVAQEIKMAEDNPEDYVYDIFSASYFPDHPLGMPILGKEINIEHFTRDELFTHFRKYYSPGSMVITATGRIDHDLFVTKIERLFGSLNNSRAETAPLGSPVPTPGIVVLEKDLEHIYLCVGTHGPSQVDRNRYALYILNALMGGSMSSHLFQEIREKRGLVYNIYSYVNCYHDVGTFGISTSTSREFLEEVLGLVKAEIVRIRDKGITDAELNFSKDHIKGNLFMSMESSEARMGRLAKNEIYFNSYIPLKETLREIGGIQKAQVNEIARHIFQRPDQISLAVLGGVDKKLIESLWKS